MKINQHNYEHYFLMYIDNELSELDKLEVTEFIKLYPVFAKELQDLQKTKIQPSASIFEDKLSLYQISEQDAQCLTYLDKEMTQIEIAQFEKKLMSNPLLHSNLDQWRKTLLTKEAVDKIPADLKNILYRKETAIKPLWAYASFKQWASVAAILAFVIGLTLFKQQNNQKVGNITFNNNVKRTELNKVEVIEKEIDKNTHYSKDLMVLNTIKKRVPISIIRSKIQDQNTQINNETNSFNNINAAVSKQDVAIVSLPKEAINTKSADEIITVSKEITPTTTAFMNDEMKNNFDEIFPTQIQYNNIDTEEDERSINIANLEIDGAKFRAISRKITTLLKRNKPENEKYK